MSPSEIKINTILGRLARLQPWYVLTKHQNRWSRAIFASINAFISIAAMTAAALYTKQPLIFPSLGPSAFLFFYNPSSPSSSPRNAFLGHGIGILIGWFCYYVCFAFFESSTAAQIASVALSLGTVSALMIGLECPHPPAASTTLIVSLGLMVEWQELVALMAAVVVLTAQAFVINRLSGVHYPLWRIRPGHEKEGLVPVAMKTNPAAKSSDPYADLAERLAARKQVIPPGKPN